MAIRILSPQEIPTGNGSAMPSVMKKFSSLIGLYVGDKVTCDPEPEELPFKGLQFTTQDREVTSCIFTSTDDEGNGPGQLNAWYNGEVKEDILDDMDCLDALDMEKIVEVGYLTDSEWDWQRVAPYFKCADGVYYFAASDKGGGVFFINHNDDEFTACTFPFEESSDD